MVRIHANTPNIYNIYNLSQSYEEKKLKRNNQLSNTDKSSHISRQQTMVGMHQR